jgi:hypothetical protein
MKGKCAFCGRTIDLEHDRYFHVDEKLYCKKSCMYSSNPEILISFQLW